MLETETPVKVLTMPDSMETPRPEDPSLISLAPDLQIYLRNLHTWCHSKR